MTELPEEILGDLRQAWAELDVEPQLRELAEEDAATRRCVQWMRAAYAAQQAPAMRARRRVHRRPLLLRSAAAAALLTGGLLVLTQTPFSSSHRTIEGTVLGNTAAGDGQADSMRSIKAQVLRTTAERTEMRAGSVRLTLINPVPKEREDR